MVSVRTTVSGFGRVFQVQVEKLSDLREPLKQVAAEIREQSRKTFKEGRGRTGQAWQQLAQSTRERLSQTTAGKLTRTGKVKKAYVEQVSQYLERQQRAGKFTAAAGAEFYRLTHGGNASESVEASVSKSFRQLRRELDQRQRLERAKQTDAMVEMEVFEDKRGRARVRILSDGYRKDARVAFPRDIRKVGERFSVPASYVTDVGGNYYRVAPQAVTGPKSALAKHQILGRIYTMIRMKVTNKGASIGLLDDSPLAIHNVGGPVGKGAKVPARPFIELIASDMDRLGELIMDWVLPS